jgi:hypothetical protein
VSAQGTVPCSSCGAPVPFEHSRCSRCGTQLRYGALADLPTMPGAPLIRTARRKRISSHDLVPQSLRDEHEELQREHETRREQGAGVRAQKFAWAAATGAALTAVPLAIPTFLFLPGKWDALLLLFLDLMIGGLAGSITLRLGGGALRGLVVFSVGFATSVWLKIHLHYPMQHHPVAFPVLMCAVVACALVASVVGVALDEHGDQF